MRGLLKLTLLALVVNCRGADPGPADAGTFTDAELDRPVHDAWWFGHAEDSPATEATTAVSADGSAPSDATRMPARFRERIVLEGLAEPTALRFARDGRVFVAEKRGVIKQYDSIDDRRAKVVADLSTEVHSCGDRGLMDIELDPDFPAEPHVYAFYTLDGRIGESVALGSVPRYHDKCPGQDAAAVAAGRLVRLTLKDDVDSTNGSQLILVENWAQPFISHSVGSLAFGPDGFLYASAGDGANFNHVDYGQLSGNPLREPPDPSSTGQKPPTAMGGALRAQVVEPPATGAGAFPRSYSGKVIRIDPKAKQPPVVIAAGLRNPFRMTFRPATAELWIGDVGWAAWEELNRIKDVRRPELTNFGWPCFEGSVAQAGYQAAGLDLCTALYARPAGHVPPVFAYPHGAEFVEGDGCGRGQSALSALAFHQGGAYPPEYAGALFLADYARQCIWVIPAGGNGAPDPARRRVFARETPQPVDLRSGPEGDIYYLDFRGGTIRRFEYEGGNHPPRATIAAEPMVGALPLKVTFDASGSEDPDAADVLAFAWDLDGDGKYEDGDGRRVSRTYTERARVTVGVRVSDRRGATATASLEIWPGHSVPIPKIEAVEPRNWRTGDTVTFRGQAMDGEGRKLPASALTWSVVVHHCPDGCHEHPLEQFVARESASFTAPDHEYPMHLSLELRAEADGLAAVTRQVLMPRTTNVLFQSRPSGLRLVVNGSIGVTPFARTVIRRSAISLSAPSQVNGTSVHRFLRWSNAGEQNQVWEAESWNRPLVAVFETIPLTAVERAASRILIDPAPPSAGAAGAENADLERLRDGVKPPLDGTDTGRQVLVSGARDSGERLAVGYEYAVPQLFARVVFQEGMHYDDGGYFDSVGVEVRQGQQWVKVKNLQSSPAYLGFNVAGWETFALDFEPVLGDAIRIVGEPGGSARYVSIAELEIWAGPM